MKQDSRAPRPYYISTTGDDTQDGSLTAPWRTLARVQELALVPGDQILLAGGEVHQGSLLLQKNSGTAELPIRVGSYGSGRARIAAGTEGAVLLHNVCFYEVRDLELCGDGYPANAGHGLCLYADRFNSDREDGKWPSIKIEKIEIHGFGRAGMAIGSTEVHGFADVKLHQLHSHHNAYAGLFVWAGGEDYAHKNLAITECVTEFNSGIPGLIHPAGHGIHSGHGILISCVDHALIESCVANDNGSSNTAHNCGPAGIWVSNSRFAIVRRNESFRNRTASATDGGGFGLDGGVSDSRLEENYSHDNDGPGFLLSQYYGAKTFRNNSIVRNVSENDARCNDNGALHVWGPADDLLENLLIEGNTVKLSATGTGRPRALLIDARTKNLRVLNNRFDTQGVPIVLEVPPLQIDLHWRDNDLSASEGAVLWEGRLFEKVARWLEILPE